MRTGTTSAGPEPRGGRPTSTPQRGDVVTRLGLVGQLLDLVIGHGHTSRHPTVPRVRTHTRLTSDHGRRPRYRGLIRMAWMTSSSPSSSSNTTISSRLPADPAPTATHGAARPGPRPRAGRRPGTVPAAWSASSSATPCWRADRCTSTGSTVIRNPRRRQKLADAIRRHADGARREQDWAGRSDCGSPSSRGSRRGPRRRPPAPGDVAVPGAAVGDGGHLHGAPWARSGSVR